MYNPLVGWLDFSEKELIEVIENKNRFWSEFAVTTAQKSLDKKKET